MFRGNGTGTSSWSHHEGARESKWEGFCKKVGVSG